MLPADPKRGRGNKAANPTLHTNAVEQTKYCPHYFHTRLICSPSVCYKAYDHYNGWSLYLEPEYKNVKLFMTILTMYVHKTQHQKNCF